MASQTTIAVFQRGGITGGASAFACFGRASRVMLDLDLDLDLGHRPGRPLGAAQRERRRVVLLENPMLLDVTVEVA